jgi:hypothetical protein
MRSATARGKVAALALVFTVCVAAPSDAAVVDGGSRFMGRVDLHDTEYAVDASILMTRTGWPEGSATVVLAPETSWPDHLAAAALAGSDGSAMLTWSTGFDVDVGAQSDGSLSDDYYYGPSPDEAAEIERLAPKHLMVVGGTGVFPDKTVIRIAAAAGTNPTVTRLAGTDRYATAAAVADRHAPGGIAYVATGQGYADAIAGAAAAGVTDAAVLLVTRDSIPAVTATALDRLRPASVVVLGGTAAVSTAVERQLADVAPVTRLAGATRYATSIAVNEHVYGEDATFDDAVGASGSHWVSPLIGAVLAAKRNVPLILTGQQCAPPDTAVYAASLQLPKWTFIQGSAGTWNAAGAPNGGNGNAIGWSFADCYANHTGDSATPKPAAVADAPWAIDGDDMPITNCMDGAGAIRVTGPEGERRTFDLPYFALVYDDPDPFRDEYERQNPIPLSAGWGLEYRLIPEGCWAQIVRA